MASEALPAVPEVPRNLGTAKQACDIAGVNRSTLRNWLRQGLISAVRVGSGPYRYDLDEIAAMVVRYPRDDVDQRIRELIDGAPEFTPQQINRIRLLLHAAPEVSGTGRTPGTEKTAPPPEPPSQPGTLTTKVLATKILVEQPAPPRIRVQCPRSRSAG